MSIETTIHNVLSSLFPGQVYPDFAPQNAVPPLCVYQQVGGKAVNYLEPVASDKKNARMQITVWSKSRAEAATMIRRVEDLMVAEPVLASVIGAAISRYDDVTELRGALQDFSVWG